MSVSKAQSLHRCPDCGFPARNRLWSWEGESVKNLRAYLQSACPDVYSAVPAALLGRSHAMLSNPSYLLAKSVLLSFRSWVSRTASRGSVSVRLGHHIGSALFLFSVPTHLPLLTSVLLHLPCWVACVPCLMSWSSLTEDTLKHTLLQGGL